MSRVRLFRLVSLGAMTFAVVAAAFACSSFSEAGNPADETPDSAADGSAAADGSTPVTTRPDGAVIDGGRASLYRAAILADQPLAYWRMGTQGNDFTVADETGGGNDLTLEGGYNLGASGAIDDDDDTAIKFDGTTGRARAARPRAFDFPDAGPFTLELWAKRDAKPADGHVFQHMLSEMTGVNTNRTGFSLYAVASTYDGGPEQKTSFEYNAYDGGDLSTSAPLIAEGKWAHYVAVFDPAKGVSLYVDGAGGAPRAVKGLLTLKTADLFIGGDESSGTFAGAIDEVAIYARALPFAQIAAHKNLGRPK